VTDIRQMLLSTDMVQESIEAMQMKAKIEKHGFIRWLIRVFCPGFHLAQNPTRKEKSKTDATSAVYPTHEE